jgi:HSP20 family protein
MAAEQPRLEGNMPETKTKPEHSQQGLQRQDRSRQQNVQRWSSPFASPFEFMDRMTEEMDRTFDRMFQNFGVPRRSFLRGSLPGTREAGFTPRVEAFQKGDQFIVRADLPGMKRDDVHVELTDDALTIHGERKEEHEESREGYFHSEREYGQFYRTVPLPEGVIGESAQASFKDGVLEVTMKAAPAEANRGRKLEIK